MEQKDNKTKRRKDDTKEKKKRMIYKKECEGRCKIKHTHMDVAINDGRRRRCRLCFAKIKSTHFIWKLSHVCQTPFYDATRARVAAVLRYNRIQMEGGGGLEEGVMVVHFLTPRHTVPLPCISIKIWLQKMFVEYVSIISMKHTEDIQF